MLMKKDFSHNVLLVPVNQCWHKNGLKDYDATRYSWIVAKDKVESVKYVLAVKNGEIVGAFEPEVWKAAKKQNFPDIPDHHGNWEHQEWRPGHFRFGFHGREAPDEIWSLYVGKQIAKELRGQGVRYVIRGIR